MRKNISLKQTALLAAIGMLVFSACRKNDYYIDGGLSKQSEEEKRMTVYDFLKSRSNHMFDSLVKIIDLTNTKAAVNAANITFFAAPNNAVLRLQMNYNPDDRQTPKPLADIGKDTLTTLLARFIVPNAKVDLETAVKDKQRYYPAANGDSLLLSGVDGGTSASSSLQTSAYRMVYTHLKIPGVDTVTYAASIQTHNLVTANAIVHVLTNGSSFAAGLKQKYNR
ncbi:fasciclin domain-containing protein [Chitinophaga polysaccharea]|uniref:Fasciclin domain-containing protein n=1 Tax=Chitinophaga polysaccharea TaxID=1293035 RepID=A0A561P759_9BACT|nr:fasciclin domain-containing protein [Chitinophaga polysaccharea]TWF33947.1 fasciclin domain-containing protein [Chitinophaga polysaccharea]